jgi:regulatory protein
MAEFDGRRGDRRTPCDGEPTGSTDRAAPADRAAPGDRDAPAGRAAPADWVAPVDRAASAGPAARAGRAALAGRADRVASADGVDRADRAAPADPVAPAGRVARADLDASTDPVPPAGRADPVARAASIDPVARAGRVAPVDPVAKAKEICLDLLAIRSRTKAELRTRLLRRGIEEPVADQVLSRLDEVGLVDDAAFAEQWVRSRHTYQGMARRALSAELRRKGVADHVAAEAVSTLDGEAEESRARDLVRKRLRTMGAAPELTVIRRLVGMLARKGYPEGLAYRVVRDELRAAGSDAEPLDGALPD